MDRIRFHEAILLAGANNWGQLKDFIVVEYDGEPAAATSAHLSSMPDIRPITVAQVQALSDYLQLSPQKARALLHASIRKFGAFGDLPHLRHPAEYVLEFGAVMPQFEGKGATRAFAAHITRALDAGCGTLGIQIMVGNDLPLKALERWGVYLHSTLTAEQVGHGFPGVRRLVLDLRALPSNYRPGAPLEPVRAHD
jgi:hypothetical protein